MRTTEGRDRPRRLPLINAAQTNRSNRKQPLPTALRLVGGLALLVILGTLILMLPIMGSERPLRANEAFFTAVSALSVTGLSIISPARDLSLLGQIVLLVLIQIGGVGFMVAAAVALRLLGRRLSLIDRLALTDSLGLASPEAIIKLTRQILLAVLVIEGTGAFLLYLHWRLDPRLSESQALFYGIFHAVSAFCNAGFDLFYGLDAYPGGFPNDNLTLIIIGSLIFIGGLGIPVLYDLVNWPSLRRLSLHTRLTLRVVAILIFAGAFGMFIAEGRVNGALYEESTPRQMLISLFQSVSSRTAGFAGLPNFAELTPPTQLLLIALMFIGCPPASMGGGITTGTFAVLSLSVLALARGHQTAIFAGRAVAVGTVRRAAAIFSISTFVVLLATWLIMMTHAVPIHVALFEVVSAFATCGLSLAFTSELNLFGQIVICVMMFWGRLGALTLVIALGRLQGQSEPVTYPEEPILIG